MTNFKNNNVLMSLKTHYLFEHSDLFPPNSGGMGAERRKFPQRTSSICKKIQR